MEHFDDNLERVGVRPSLITDISEKSVILNLLSENFAWINDAWDVFHVNIFWLMTLSNHVFYEIYMFDYFRCDWSWPLEAGLVVFVDFGPIVCFRHSDVNVKIF